MPNGIIQVFCRRHTIVYYLSLLSHLQRLWTTQCELDSVPVGDGGSGVFVFRVLLPTDNAGLLQEEGSRDKESAGTANNEA